MLRITYSTEYKLVSNVNLRYAMQLECLIEHIVCMRRIVVQVPLWSVEQSPKLLGKVLMTGDLGRTHYYHCNSPHGSVIDIDCVTHPRRDSSVDFLYFTKDEFTFILNNHSAIYFLM